LWIRSGVFPRLPVGPRPAITCSLAAIAMRFRRFWRPWIQLADQYRPGPMAARSRGCGARTVYSMKAARRQQIGVALAGK
jgi:hypothetical protein